VIVKIPNTLKIKQRSLLLGVENKQGNNLEEQKTISSNAVINFCFKGETLKVIRKSQKSSLLSTKNAQLIGGLRLTHEFRLIISVLLFSIPRLIFLCCQAAIFCFGGIFQLKFVSLR